MNHKHTWTRTDDEDSDKIICENCGVDYDEWVGKMKSRGYTMEQLKRFENQ